MKTQHRKFIHSKSREAGKGSLLTLFLFKETSLSAAPLQENVAYEVRSCFFGATIVLCVTKKHLLALGKPGKRL